MSEEPEEAELDFESEDDVIIVLPDDVTVAESAPPPPPPPAPSPVPVSAPRKPPPSKPTPSSRPSSPTAPRRSSPAVRPVSAARRIPRSAGSVAIAEPPPPRPPAAALEAERSIEGERAPGSASLRAPILAGLLSAGLLGVILAVGRSYYVTPPVSRALHFQHAVFRPSGPVGLTLGMVGLAVILLSLLYVLRKRFASLRHTGSLRGWLAWHVLAGIVGPGAILLHSAFAPSSAAGLLAFAAMWVVVLSGFAGRYIHVHVPKTLDGRELGLDEVRARIGVYGRKLAALGVDASHLMTAPAPRRLEWLWLLHAIGGLLWGDRAARRDFEDLREALSSSLSEGSGRDEALELSRRLARERQWLARHREVQKLMAAWRFFHGWFVAILLAGVLFHVLLAFRFGDLWILGGRR